MLISITRTAKRMHTTPGTATEYLLDMLYVLKVIDFVSYMPIREFLHKHAKRGIMDL